MKLFCTKGDPNSAKIVALLSAINIECEIHYMDADDLDDEEEFQELSPDNNHPLLKTSLDVFDDTNTILRYLSKKNKAKKLSGTLPREEAKIDYWLDYTYRVIDPLIIKSIELKQRGDIEELDQVIFRLEDEIREKIEPGIASKGFIVGYRPSLPDLVLTVYMYYPFKSIYDEKLAPKFPSFTEYLDTNESGFRLSTLPKWFKRLNFTRRKYIDSPFARRNEYRKIDKDKKISQLLTNLAQKSSDRVGLDKQKGIPERMETESSSEAMIKLQGLQAIGNGGGLSGEFQKEMLETNKLLLDEIKKLKKQISIINQNTAALAKLRTEKNLKVSIPPSDDRKEGNEVNSSPQLNNLQNLEAKISSTRIPIKLKLNGSKASFGASPKQDNSNKRTIKISDDPKARISNWGAQVITTKIQPFSASILGKSRRQTSFVLTGEAQASQHREGSRLRTSPDLEKPKTRVSREKRVSSKIRTEPNELNHGVIYATNENPLASYHSQISNQPSQNNKTVHYPSRPPSVVRKESVLHKQSFQGSIISPKGPSNPRRDFRRNLNYLSMTKNQGLNRKNVDPLRTFFKAKDFENGSLTNRGTRLTSGNHLENSQPQSPNQSHNNSLMHPGRHVKTYSRDVSREPPSVGKFTAQRNSRVIEKIGDLNRRDQSINRTVTSNLGVGRLVGSQHEIRRASPQINIINFPGSGSYIPNSSSNWLNYSKSFL